MKRVFFVLVVILAPFGGFTQTESLGECGFDPILKSGDLIIAGFGSAVMRTRILDIFMHRAKALFISHFIVMDGHDSTLIAYRYAHRDDTFRIITSTRFETIRVRTTGWQIIAFGARISGYFTMGGDLQLVGSDPWYTTLETEDP